MIIEFFIGTYAQDPQSSVYRGVIDTHTKEMNITPVLAPFGAHTSFLIFNKDKSRIYAVNEMNQETDKKFSSVVALKRSMDGGFVSNSTGGMEFSTEGNFACHLCVSADERLLFVSNYGSGLLSVFSLDEQGALQSLLQNIQFSGTGPKQDRQESAHVHHAILSPCGEYLCVADLGTDSIYIFKIHVDKQEPLVLHDTIKVPGGNGPRHMAWSQDKKYLFVCGELSASVMQYEYSFQAHTLSLVTDCFAYPAHIQDYSKNTSAEIICRGKYVYVSNRGFDEIAIFSQEQTGVLSHIRNISSRGAIPRNFNIVETETGAQLMIVAHQDSGNVVCFSIHEDTLEFESEIKGLHAPVCICV